MFEIQGVGAVGVTTLEGRDCDCVEILLAGELVIVADDGPLGPLGLLGPLRLLDGTG